MDNWEATGYMLLACKELKREMYYQFDLKTEKEAERLGQEYYQNLD